MDDEELVKSIIGTLALVFTPASLGPEDSKKDDDSSIEVGLCEIFLKEKDIFEGLLIKLHKVSQSLRYDILQLIGILAERLPQTLPTALLSTPGAISNILELIDDPNDVIRTETIMLLQLLTENSSEVQRVSAFEGAFEKLFELIFSEGGIIGGEALVEDALLVAINMLRFNPSNQNFFRESPCLPKLKLLLHPLNENATASVQIFSNYKALAELVCLLCDKDSPSLGSHQSALFKAGIFEPLIETAFHKSLSSKIRESAMIILDHLLLNNPSTRQVFSLSLVMTDSKCPIPAVLAAIRVIARPANDSNTLRLTAVNMLGSYLINNPDGQVVIAATFKPPIVGGTPSIDDQSAGSVIIEHVVDLSTTRKDPKRVILAALLLSHVLRGNEQCKTITLQHCLQEEELFINRILMNLMDAVKDQSSFSVNSAIAYLILFSTWLWDYQKGVSFFLSEGSNVQFVRFSIHFFSIFTRRLLN